MQNLIETFQPQRNLNPDFFGEWQRDWPNVADLEKQLLDKVQVDKVQTSYSNLVNSPALLENAVRVTMLGPLLLLADLFSSCFISGLSNRLKSQLGILVLAF